MDLTCIRSPASISVLVAQTLSLAVADSLREKLAVALGGDGGVRSNAFVDDIFVSITPAKPVPRSQLEQILNNVVDAVSKEHGVSLKIFQCAENPGRYPKALLTSPLLSQPEPKQAENPPACPAALVPELILGVTYTIATFEIRITENFQSRARSLVRRKKSFH